jgi:hypothetical protein
LEKFSKRYPSEWFFDAKSYQEAGFKTIQLKKIYRQKDEKLVRILNNIRSNEVTDDDLNALNECKNHNLEVDPILLTTHKIKAFEVNNTILDSLSGNEIIIQ